MSRGHGASRRRSYGRRQHELRERRSRASQRYPRPWLAFDADTASDGGDRTGPAGRPAGGPAEGGSTQPGSGT
jgi:hypothetical protein